VPNLRIYRSAWIAPAVVALATLLFLHSPVVPPLSDQPTSFDGARALADTRSLVQQFPSRTPGSDSDVQSSIWLVERLRKLGLQPHIDTFTGVVEGRSVAMQNIWAVSPGTARGAVVVLANRDSPPLDVQGADENAAGVAAVLELTRVFTLATHAHPFIFLWTDGDVYGSLGARSFVARHADTPLLAALALRRVGAAGAARVSLDGWSASPRVAPPWLWILTSSSMRGVGALRAPLPNIVTQGLRLAAPVGSGSQGPFVEAGVPAISLGVAGHRPPPQLDVLASLSAQTLSRIGRGSEALLTSIDGSATPLSRSSSSVFFSRYRTLSGRLVALTLLTLVLPLAAVTLDLFARTRRRATPLRHAWRHFAIRLAPWIALLLIVYGASLVGLLPAGRGTPLSPDSQVAHHPRLMGVVLLVVLAVLAYRYAAVRDRRCLRRATVTRDDVVLVAHLVLVGAAIVTFLVNPFSLLLLLPAVILWPLAAPGLWRRSLLPVVAGFAAFAAAILMFAVQLHLGLAVWWYLFILLANGTVPVPIALSAAAVLAAAIMLAQELTRPAPPAAVPLQQPGAPDEPVERLEDGVATITVTVTSPNGGHQGQRKTR
jgi:hypothetical protein